MDLSLLLLLKSHVQYSCDVLTSDFISKAQPGTVVMVDSGNELMFVCVIAQHYVSIFLTRLLSVLKPLLFDTQNSEISGFSTAHAYKNKTQRQAKVKRRQQKNDIFVD